MKTFGKISRIPAFEKDLKKLLKRYRSLDDDLRTLIKSQLHLYHHRGIDNKGIVQVPGFPTEGARIFKARKFACKSLKGKGAHSGIRVIYGYIEKKDQIILIEIYYKGDREKEDVKRIQSVLANLIITP